MIKASELIVLFQQALDEGWGYIWGTRGQTWTQAQQNKATRDMTKRYGQKWVGKRVADCSGLFVWAFKQLGGGIYHGSNTMWKKYCTRQGTLTGEMDIRPGTAVFTVGSDGVRGHVGLYIGGGVCIEAKGTAYGVVTSQLSRWDEWGELAGVEYDLTADSITIAPRTLRKGDRGSDVEDLQRTLNADPRYPTKVDGIFGADTESSVRAFQADHGLTADGIVGPATRAKLDETEADEDGAEKLPQSPDGDSSLEREPTEAPEAPQEPSEESAGTSPLTCEERLTRLERAVFGQEGGESNGS